MAKILVIDDSPDYRDLFAAALKPRFEVVMLPDAEHIVELTHQHKPDLVILDIALGARDGYQACTLLQADAECRDIPIFFVTAQGDMASKVLGLNVGGDDYLVKPFDAVELVARIEARLRKVKRHLRENSILLKGALRIDLLSQMVTVKQGEKDCLLSLTPHEYRLLCYLAQHENRVFSRQELLNAVWGDAVHVVDRVIDSTISSLRKKSTQMAEYIETVFGVGYRFTLKKT